MPDLSGKKAPRVLVVEDETLVLFNLEDILTELGCVIVGPAMRIQDACTLAREADLPDLAILDVNIGGVPVFEAAQLLVERGVPLIFATGYGRDGLPEDWRGHEVIAKPYTQQDVARALDRLWSPSETPSSK